MSFPVTFHIAGRAVPAHLVLEICGYTAGFQTYLWLRRRQPADDRAKLPTETAMWVIVGCVFGALFGAKLLAWVESAPEYLAAIRSGDLAFLGGKTIVGGLLGGWVG